MEELYNEAKRKADEQCQECVDKGICNGSDPASCEKWLNAYAGYLVGEGCCRGCLWEGVKRDLCNECVACVVSRPDGGNHFDADQLTTEEMTEIERFMRQLIEKRRPV